MQSTQDSIRPHPIDFHYELDIDEQGVMKYHAQSYRMKLYDLDQGPKKTRYSVINNFIDQTEACCQWESIAEEEYKALLDEWNKKD